MWVTGRHVALAAVALLLAAVPGAGGHGSGSALAQDMPDPRESGVENVRKRMREAGQADPTEPYWEHFRLMNTGRCAEAIPAFRRLAGYGRGYEHAQLALGLCLLDQGDEGEAKAWIARAADAGHAGAQATRVRLFATEGAAYMTPEAAAMWLYLYETNPLRLQIGTPNALEPEIADAVRASIPRADYLAGINRARNWTPVFAESSVPPDAGPNPFN